MFENITKGEFSVSDREPTANQYGVYGLDVDISGIYENAITIWLDKQYPTDKEQEDAEFIAYCFNLQQKYDISKLEECVKALQELTKKFDYKNQAIYSFAMNDIDKAKSVLTKIIK